MLLSRRQRGWLIGLVLLAVMITFIVYPYVLIDTPIAVLFSNMELAVIVVLFGGMLFLLGLILYLGN